MWCAGSFLVLLLLAAGGAVLWLSGAETAALPALDGEQRIPGLSAPVTVERDAHGVPHIEAATQDDLFLAQATSPPRIACGRWIRCGATPTANWPRFWDHRS